MVGLLIIIIFPFIFYYTQINNLNKKTTSIRKALKEGNETYIDPVDYKMRWTENGALVRKMKLNLKEKNLETEDALKIII